MASILDSPKEAMKKAEKSANKGRGNFRLLNIQNPIPEEITDSEQLSKTFEKYRLVPFAGKDNWTGHSVLYWYLMLAKLSTTHGSVIEKISRYAFGSAAYLTQGEDMDFFTGEESTTLTGPEAQRTWDEIKQYVAGTDQIKAIAKKVFFSYKATGNAFVRLDVSTVNGVVRAKISYIRSTGIMYRLPQGYTGPDKFFALSPIWTEEYLKKNPPEMVPRYPLFSEGNGGVRSTIFHLSTDYSQWYGRPDTENSDLNKYREVQQMMYSIKQSHAGFVGQIIIEIEDDGSETGPLSTTEPSRYDSFTQQFEENFTNKGGEPSTVVITSRPVGAKEMFVFQVKPNTNQDWYKGIDEIDSKKIMRSHGATLRFMGFDTPNGFSTDAFLSDYVLNMEPVISDLRNTVMRFLNSIYNEVWEQANRPDLLALNISYKTPIEDILQEYRRNLLMSKIESDDNDSPGGVTIRTR